MVKHGRYVYQPINYDEYMKNYIHTLRSGEILVDMQDYDLYVTEEGINLPIPLTRGLREAVLDFIQNKLDTVVLKKSQISENLFESAALKYKLDMHQEELYDRGMYLRNREDENRTRTVYLEKVNQRNINQLGDINAQLAKFPINEYTEEMKRYVNLFNQYNNDHGFRDNVSQQQKDLYQLWQDIVQLMDLVNKKADNLSPAWIDVNVPVIKIEEGTVQDIAWEANWLNHIETWYPRANNRNAWLDLCFKKMPKHAANWFTKRERPAQNRFYKDSRYYQGFPGTGILYKGFPWKVDLDMAQVGGYYDKFAAKTGLHLSAPGTKRVVWNRPYELDALQIPPAKNLPFKSWKDHLGDYDGLYKYITHPAAFTLSPHADFDTNWDTDATDYRTGANKNDFRRRMGAPNPGAARYGSWFNASKGLYTFDLDIDAISTPDPNNDNKRNLKSTSMADSNGWTKDYPMVPVVANSWRSIRMLGGRPNGSLYRFRIGVKKRIRETNIRYEHYSKDITKGLSSTFSKK